MARLMACADVLPAGVDEEQMSKQRPDYGGQVICFTAEVYKVQTLVDGGIRVTLDLPETDIEQMGALAQARRAGALIEVAAVPILSDRSNKLRD